MRKVRWRKRALADLANFHDWLSTLPRANPDLTMQKVENAAKKLARLGDIGRPSSRLGHRELSVGSAPYVIVYRVTGSVVEIVAVYHTAQKR